jgi:hypothetical protein
MIWQSCSIKCQSIDGPSIECPSSESQAIETQGTAPAPVGDNQDLLKKT